MLDSDGGGFYHLHVFPTEETCLVQKVEET